MIVSPGLPSGSAILNERFRKPVGICDRLRGMRGRLLRFVLNALGPSGGERYRADSLIAPDCGSAEAPRNHLPSLPGLTSVNLFRFLTCAACEIHNERFAFFILRIIRSRRRGFIRQSYQ